MNVRGDSGETPLISVARHGYFPGINLLIKNGSVLFSDDLAEGEMPLLAGTVRTLRTRLCGSVFEFSDMAKRLTSRLQHLYSRLQKKQQRKRDVQVDSLTTFATIIYQFVRVLLRIQKLKTPLSRFIGSRVIFSKLRGFHEELDSFAALLGVKLWSENSGEWRAT